MKRKKNSDERLALASRYLVPVERDEKNIILDNLLHRYLDLNNVFGNCNPIELEIGAGKGQFLIEKARRNPYINFLGVEMLTNVILVAVEHAAIANLPNIRFLITQAESLPKYLEANSISRIYLNFSTPLPNSTTERKRLTNRRFLNIYKDLLLPNGEIIQKTDNGAFFEYSLVELSNSGYIIQEVTLDLHKKEDKDNIVTEYEERFANLGMPIYRLKAKKLID